MPIHSVIDLRTDSATHPTASMKKAMQEVIYSTDYFTEDPTVSELQQLAAKKFGKEDALFVFSGTMGNLICMMVHCCERGDEAYVGEMSHIYNWEQGGGAQLGGIFIKGIKNHTDGRIDLQDVRIKYRDGKKNYYGKGKMVAIENPIHGNVLPIKFLFELKELATELDLKVHLDGARLANAVATLKCDVIDIMNHVDSATICLSKSLCAPVGSVLVGTKEFIQKARRIRKVLGGAMGQCGVLAAAGIIALTEMWDNVEKSHSHAFQFGKGLIEISRDLFDLDIRSLKTNVVCWKIKHTAGFTSQEFATKVQEITRQNKTSLKITSLSKDVLRAVFYEGFDPSNLGLALEKIKVTCQYFRNKV